MMFVMMCHSDLQNKKGNILQASVDYIKRLRKEQLAMSELVARQEHLENSNHQLALEVQVTLTFSSPTSFVLSICVITQLLSVQGALTFKPYSTQLESRLHTVSSATC